LKRAGSLLTVLQDENLRRILTDLAVGVFEKMEKVPSFSSPEEFNKMMEPLIEKLAQAVEERIGKSEEKIVKETEEMLKELAGAVGEVIGRRSGDVVSDIYRKLDDVEWKLRNAIRDATNEVKNHSESLAYLSSKNW